MITIQDRMGGGVGRGLSSGYQSGGDHVSRLPNVSDPEKTFAAITRGEYNNFVRDYGQYEKNLISNAQNDTSLVDQARADIGVTASLSQDMSKRNLSRYGGSLTPAQMKAQKQNTQMSSTLGGIQAVNDAQIQQREANTTKLADLINIGQGVNRSSQGAMGQAASDASARNQAFQNAKTQANASNIGAIGSLGSVAAAFL
jgi:hypothetical protein